MLEPVRRNPKSVPAPIVRAAKCPPDDDDGPSGGPGGGIPAGGGGIPGGGGYDPGGGGDFKKGAMKPIAVLVGGAAVVGLGVFLALCAKHEAETIPVEKAAEIKKQLLVLPLTEQIPRG